MRRTLIFGAAILVAAFVSAGLAGLAHAQVSPAGERGWQACSRAKSELLAQHPDWVTALQGPYVLAPGQENYDVKYYDVNVNIQTTLPRKVIGVLTMFAKVLSPTLTQVPLDLKTGATITSVKAGGVPTTYTFASSVLTINLNRTYVQGEMFYVEVSYSAPIAGSAITVENRTGGQAIYSLSEPFGSRSWWPCKDTPEDKADSVDIHVQLPNNFIIASNGKLTGVDSLGTRVVYNWRERYPIATYLVSFAAFPYTVYSDWYHYGAADSMEVRFFVYPDHYGDVQATYALTVPMIEVYAGIFGEYPFIQEKYGHAEMTWGGGMEHQTCTSLGGWDEYLIAHELAHMWWGDMITCNTFHHIWVNEGFATYAEALWSESQYGMEAYHHDMSATAYYGGGTIYVEDPLTQPIFDTGLSYNKGSWVLHMLRHVVGDATFFDCLQTFYSDPTMQYGTATTEQFRDLCETVSGMDLDTYFHEWIYEEYYPIYAYDWSATDLGGSYEIALAIDQRQTNYIFTMPIDVTVTTVAGETTLVVQNSAAHQEYVLTVSAQPTRVQLDKDNWILRQVVEPLPVPEFDRGILVVNGVDFENYGSEIYTAYQDSIFWGNHPISFWDCFAAPAGGYPPNLPAPLGHGAVPPDTLKQFSAVVWVGNNYNGDIAQWNDTPIYSYLEAGGDVLLLTRMGQDFVNVLLRNYLGITWRESGSSTLTNCVATYPGLVNMSLLGTQSYCAVFDTTTATAESKILFKETTGFAQPRGMGVWRKPAAGGTYRNEGGQFIFVSGRPYRWGHNELRANCQFILDNLFAEPYNPLSSVADASGGRTYQLGANRPNPFNPVTSISFAVPAREEVALRIYDVSGRLVRTLVDGPVEAGTHAVTWNGRDDAGRQVSSGVYFYRLTSGSFTDARKMVMLQ